MKSAATMDNPAPDNDASVKSRGIFLYTWNNINKVQVHNSHFCYSNINISCSYWLIILTSLLLTEPDWGASLIYSSIAGRNDGGGWFIDKQKVYERSFNGNKINIST